VDWGNYAVKKASQRILSAGAQYRSSKANTGLRYKECDCTSWDQLVRKERDDVVASVAREDLVTLVKAVGSGLSPRLTNCA
jgi:hypothetical protein